MELHPCRECGAQCRLDDQFCGWCGSREPISRPAVGARPPRARKNRPRSGEQSDRLKIVVVLLAFLLPFGIHRLYLGHTEIGVAQLLLSWFCGIGVFWVYADGIYLALGDVRDEHGRPVTRWT